MRYLWQTMKDYPEIPGWAVHGVRALEEEVEHKRRLESAIKEIAVDGCDHPHHLECSDHAPGNYRDWCYPCIAIEALVPNTEQEN